MLDQKYLLDNTAAVLTNLQQRYDNSDITPLIAQIRHSKTLQQQVEQLRHEIKQNSEKVGTLIQQKSVNHQTEINLLKDKTQQLKSYLKVQEEELAQLEVVIKPQLLRLPNLLDPSVPIGKDAADNQLVRSHGMPKANTKSMEHHEVGIALDILDFERAGKITGSRFTVLKGYGALLELALIQFMMSVHVQQHGYEAMIPPYLINPQSLTGTGQLPKFHEEVFYLEKDQYYLAPTAEVPVTNYHANEILLAESLPKKYVAFSPCFRREAGSYGKDIKGLIRQHQFHKVELVQLTTPEQSAIALESMVADAEKILQLLELPYRIMSLCSGDIGFSAAKCYDIEVWLQGAQTYREISSCSNCTDFQARRLNLRYRPATGGKPQFLHTLNGSALAVGRTLIAILEYYSNADGSVTIPKVLRPYFLLGHVDKIELKNA